MKINFQHIEPQHTAIHERLLNWARWVADHPRSITQPMWRQAKSSRQWDVDPHISVPVNTIDASAMEKAVYKLPVQNRAAIRWYYVGRNNVYSQRKAQGLTEEALCKAVRDGRTMLINQG